MEQSRHETGLVTQYTGIGQVHYVKKMGVYICTRLYVSMYPMLLTTLGMSYRLMFGITLYVNVLNVFRM